MAEGELSEYSLGKMLKNKTLDTNVTGHGNPQLECIEFNQTEVCQPLNCNFTKNPVVYAPCSTGRQDT